MNYQSVKLMMSIFVLLSAACSTLGDEKGSPIEKSSAYGGVRAASQLLEEIKDFYRGKNKICAPRYGEVFDKEKVEKIVNFGAQDIHEIVLENEYRIIFSFLSTEGGIPLSLDVFLKGGKCIGFTISEVYSDPMDR